MITDPEKIYEELAKPFPAEVLRKRNKGGTNLTYAPVSEYIARLNLVLGPGNWSEVRTDTRLDSNWPDWVVSEVEIAVFIDGKWSSKIGHGGEDLKFYGDKNPKTAGKPLDLGDAFKGAHSDAFKKACSQLGIGLDLGRDEDALAYEESERQRLVDSQFPKLTEDDIASIKANIAELSEENRKDFGNWWKANIPYHLGSGEVTENYLQAIADKLTSYA